LIDSAEDQRKKGKFVAAEDTLLKALSIVKASDHPENYPRVLRDLMHVAYHAKWKGKYESYLADILKATQSSSIDVSTVAKIELGGFYVQEGQYKKALTYLEPAMTAIKQLYSASNPQMSIFDEDLCSAYIGAGQKEKATAVTFASKLLTDTFMDDMQNRIRRNWHPRQYTYSAKALAIYHVDNDGNISKAKIAKSSGTPAFDADCLAALKGADAKPMFSWKVYSQPMLVEFTFAYNVNKSPAGSAASTYISPENRTAQRKELLASGLQNLQAKFKTLDVSPQGLDVQACEIALQICEQYINMRQPAEANAIYVRRAAIK